MSSYYTAHKCPDCGSTLSMDDRGREGYFLSCIKCDWEMSEEEAVRQGYSVNPNTDSDE